MTASVILKQKIHINSYFLWFCAVQVRQKELGISSYGVSVTTLEEVFIKVGDHASSLLSKNGEKETSIVDESSEDSGKSQCQLWQHGKSTEETDGGACSTKLYRVMTTRLALLR